MKVLRNLGRMMSGAAFLAATTSPLPAQPAGNEWNAFYNLGSGWCFPCSEGAVGNSALCPCRIAEVIIIK